MLSESFFPDQNIHYRGFLVDEKIILWYIIRSWKRAESRARKADQDLPEVSLNVLSAS